MNENRRRGTLSTVAQPLGEAVLMIAHSPNSMYPDPWAAYLACNLVTLAGMLNAAQNHGIEYEQIRAHIGEAFPDVLDVLDAANACDSPIKIGPINAPDSVSRN